MHKPSGGKLCICQCIHRLSGPNWPFCCQRELYVIQKCKDVSFDQYAPETHCFSSLLAFSVTVVLFRACSHPYMDWFKFKPLRMNVNGWCQCQLITKWSQWIHVCSFSKMHMWILPSVPWSHLFTSLKYFAPVFPSYLGFLLQSARIHIQANWQVAHQFLFNDMTGCLSLCGTPRNQQLQCVSPSPRWNQLDCPLQPLIGS